MTEDAARTVLDAMLQEGSALAGLAIRSLRCVYLEIPEGNPQAPSRLRDARAWRAELWGDMRGARVTLDDRSGAVLGVEYL